MFTTPETRYLVHRLCSWILLCSEKSRRFILLPNTQID